MKKTLKISIIVTSILLFLFLLLYLLITINFIVRSELHLKIEPIQKTINSDYNETININFTVHNNNFWFCKSKCTFELYDPYTMQTIKKETQIYNSNSIINKRYNLNLDVRGEGQRHYYFITTCNNIESLACKTKSNNYTQSSLVTINYQEPKKELEIKNDLLAILNNNILKINKIKSNIEYSFKLNRALKQNLTNNLTKLNQSYENITNQINLIKEQWNNYEYLEIDLSQLKIEELSNKINTTKIYLEGLKNTYNNIIEKINFYNNNIINFSQANYFFNQSINLTKELNNSLEKINLTINLTNYLESFNKIKNQITLNYTNNITYFNKISEYFNLTNETKVNFNTINNNSNNITTSDKLNFLLLQNITNQINLSINNSGIFIDNKKLFNNTNNLSKTNLINSIYIPEEYFRIITNYERLTKSLNNYSVLNKINKTKINITKNEINVIDYFQKNEKQCCIFEECKNCELKTNPPILLLHGHAFNKDNPVESSLKSMYNLQKSLSDNKLYINGAEISTQIQKNSLSEMFKPLSFRASYYLIYDLYSTFIRKDENLETYSIRLKELIDLTLEKSNSEKLTIIAHSMGGLVARKYIQIFGEEKIDKLIMIGTPNNGVEGRIKDLCKTFGANRECEDMSQGSIFLRRLNNYQPKNITKFYLIYATGCDTNNQQGDGIVTKQSAILNYTNNFEINGECKTTASLHNDILDPKKYPKTLDFLKEILKI